MHRTLTVLKALANMFYEDFYGTTFLWGAVIIPILWIINVFNYISSPFSGIHHFTFFISIAYFIPFGVYMQPNWRGFRRRAAIFIILIVIFLLLNQILSVSIGDNKDLNIDTQFYSNGHTMCDIESCVTIYSSYYYKYTSLSNMWIVIGFVFYISLTVISVDVHNNVQTAIISQEQTSIAGAFTQSIKHLQEALGQEPENETTDNPNPDDNPDYRPDVPNED